ncbi:MAG: hypothetical protein AB7T63_16320 [Planctomycetota bacterium]
MRWGALATFVLMGLGGCQTVKRVHYDQAGARDAITQLQSDQIFDNVVRLYNGLPIVHIDYKEVQARTEDTIGGEWSGASGRDRTSKHGPSVTEAVTTDAAGGMSSVATTVLDNSRSLVDKLGQSAKVGGSSVSWLELDADPVVNTPHAGRVYGAYMKFVSTPGNLICCSSPPHPGQAIVAKAYGGSWYFVPAHDGARHAYRELALATLGFGAPPKPTAIRAKVASVDKFNVEPHGTHHDATIQFESAVPNRDGHMLLAAAGSELRLQVVHIDGIPIGSMTQKLTLQYPVALLAVMPWEVFQMLAINRPAELHLGETSLGGSHLPGPDAISMRAELEYLNRSQGREYRDFLREAGR